MTEREKLQACYELAFFPPRLNEAWDKIKQNKAPDMGELGELLDMALLLHLALPEKGYASQRALTRLALYQARARAFGMVGIIKRLRRRLNRPPLTVNEIPGNMVRDIGLPDLSGRNLHGQRG